MEAILESLFLKILNMSLTASYVILAVMLIRLLLRRAPRKYSYALWAAAAFRLVCPVSFESMFSLFSLKGFRLNVEASSAGTAEIVHIPENIGYMAQPEITTGITAVNNAVNPLLPAATPQVSANPMQIWIFIGAAVWCLGMVLLLAYSLISLIRLKRRLRTATILEGRVWQSENVRSPFILGLIRPRIYIPYGLGGTERGYVLEHERAHIRRGDHIVKILAYFILCLHWFNPLVWLSYYLMTRDMETSCDERVLSRDPGIGADYSATLLSFATGGRFPAPSPLAFGESGVKGRIKNALRWKKPKLWVSITALVLCIAVVAACAANPKEDSVGTSASSEIDEEMGIAPGSYVSWDCVYRDPEVSYVPLGGNSGYRYSLDQDGITAAELATGKEVWHYDIIWQWQDFPYSDQEWAAMQVITTGFYVPLSEQYEEILYQPFMDFDHFLMLVDGQLWLAETAKDSGGDRYILSIHSLVPEEEMGCAAGTYMPAVSSRWGIELSFDIENLDHVNIVCETGVVGFQPESGSLEIKDWATDTDNSLPAGSSLVWNPMDDGGLCSTGVIQFTALTDTQGISGTIYLEHSGGDGGEYIYTVRVVGTGLHISQDEDGRISITHSGDGAWDIPTVSEADDSLLAWLHDVRAQDIAYLSSKYGVDPGLLRWPAFTGQLLNVLQSISPDELYTDEHGSPAQAILTLHEDSEDSVSLLYCGDTVELGFGGAYFEAYGGGGVIWKIKNEALCSLFEYAMQAAPAYSEEMLTGLDAGLSSATLCTSGGYFRLSAEEWQAVAELLQQETTVVAQPGHQQAMTADIMYILQVVFADGTENYIFGSSEGDVFYRYTGTYGSSGDAGYVKIVSPELSGYLYRIASIYDAATEAGTAQLTELLDSLEWGKIQYLSVGVQSPYELYAGYESGEVIAELLRLLSRLGADELSAPAVYSDYRLQTALDFGDYRLWLQYAPGDVKLIFSGSWGELNSEIGMIWSVSSPELEEYLANFAQEYVVYTGANRSGE